MPPRIANDCFPDELLTVDYDPTIGMGMLPGGGGGGGGGIMDAPMPMGIGGGGGRGGGVMGTAAAAGNGGGGGGGVGGTGTMGNVDMMLGEDDNDDDGAAAAIVAAAAVAIAEEESASSANTNTTVTTTQTAGAAAAFGPGMVGGNSNNNNNNNNNNLHPTSIENDPLSMLGQAATIGGMGGIGHSHSSSGADNVMLDRYAVFPTMTNNATIGAPDTAMATTVTVPMTMAAQQDWDQFVAASAAEQQQQQQQHHQQGSPSSIPHVTSPSTASLLAQYRGTPPPLPSSGLNLGSNSTTTPLTYQQLLLLQQQQQQQQQHRQDSVVHGATTLAMTPLTYQQHQHRQDNNMNASVTSTASRVALAQQQQHHQHFLRASSFGGFPAPSRGPASRNYDEQQHQPSQVSAPSSVASVSRSNSVASSLTTSLPNSVRSNNNASYHHFLSSLQEQQQQHSSLLPNSPLEMIPFSDGDEDSPQETYGSIHSTSEHSSSLFGSSRSSPNNNNNHSKLSPGEETNTTAVSSSPSAGLSLGGAHSPSSPKLPYSPSLLDQTSFPEEEDLSIGDEDDDDNGSDHSPISKLNWRSDGEDKESKQQGLSTNAAVDTNMSDHSTDASRLTQGIIASHVIHEDSALPDGTSPRMMLPASSLRPRPSPYASGDVSSPVGGEIPTTVVRPQYRYQISDVSIASHDGSVQLHVQPPPPLSFGPDTSISDLTYYAEKGCIVDVLAALSDATPMVLSTMSRGPGDPLS